jgi:DNA-binding HxlR family transcriptional regulator
VRGDGTYALTTLGHDARKSLDPVIEWSRRWAAALADAPPATAENADGG